jgi:hypothetical protein
MIGHTLRPLSFQSVLSRALLPLLIASKPLVAQSQNSEYAVKAVCGESKASSGATISWRGVMPGRYFTAINIWNAGIDTAHLTIALAATQPISIASQLIRLPKAVTIPPRVALEVDCEQVMGALPRDIVFFKGFAVLDADRELEIVAVYTAGPRAAAVQTMEVERVTTTSRTMPTCPDLTIIGITAPQITGNSRTQMRVAVRNIGSAGVSNIEVKVEDQSRTSANRISSSTISYLGANSQAAVTLELPYIVSPSDWGSLLFSVDSKEQIAECNENNNERRLTPP